MAVRNVGRMMDALSAIGGRCAAFVRLRGGIHEENGMRFDATGCTIAAIGDPGRRR